MNDEELVEVMAGAICLGIDSFENCFAPESHRKQARSALAALRSAGFQVFKPEDCEWVVKDEEFIADRDCYLVPIPGGRDER